MARHASYRAYQGVKGYDELVKLLGFQSRFNLLNCEQGIIHLDNEFIEAIVVQRDDDQVFRIVYIPKDSSAIMLVKSSCGQNTRDARPRHMDAVGCRASRSPLQDHVAHRGCG